MRPFVLYANLYTSTSSETWAMRVKQFALPWSAAAALALATGACATMQGLSALSSDGSQGTSRLPSWRVERDSVAAQQHADEVGPRVSIRASMDHYAGSRQVEASFHMYDDAYVVVGHLDAGGRMRVVFPQQPGDDGFVKADKIYHVPSFFAGFADEYRWRYAEYRNRYHTARSRLDSYDAGLGYVFIIASWRPMRLDRITDGDKWERYEIADINYMSDPREAIEELGGLIAGDNREAYTIEYARYTTTNYGTYSLASFNSCYQPGFGYTGFGRGLVGFGYSAFPFGMMSAFGGSSLCGISGYYSYPQYAFGYPGYSPGVVMPPIIQPPPIVRPPAGTAIARRPRFPGDTATSTVISRRPRQQAAEENGAQNSGYRRRGLVAEDAPPPGRNQAGRRRPVDDVAGDDTRRPGLHEMIGAGRIRETPRPINDGGFSGRSREPADENIARARGSYRGGISQPADEDRSGPRSVPAGRSHDDGFRPSDSSPRGVDRSPPRIERSEPRSESPRDGGTRATPTPPSSPPPAPPRSEPASSGSDRRKPGA